MVHSRLRTNNNYVALQSELNSIVACVVQHTWIRTDRSRWPSAHLPEHLKSCSCRSATFWPLSWPGEWHRVYGARRDAFFRYRANQERWQSHANGFSERRSARRRGIPANMSRGSVVMLLLFKVLQARNEMKWKRKVKERNHRISVVVLGSNFIWTATGELALYLQYLQLC